MILHGNQRGGAKNLALHLLKDENEHVELHELRGFVSHDLVAALGEIHAVSKGTKAKQFLFSLSLNPPPKEDVPTSAFENAITRVEDKLGLSGQPRAIVFHEKEGRRHAHCVWSRIDTDQMKAIPLSFSKRKLMEVSRELFLEHGWEMPRGMMNPAERDPRNFTLAEWQQAKRLGHNPKDIKRTFQDCWAASDSQQAFQSALKERGYTLARGDRRGFVALDYACEVYAVAKWVGIKAKDVRARLTGPDSLPSVEEARVEIAGDMARHLTDLRKQQKAAVSERLAEIHEQRRVLTRRHQEERSALKAQQQERQHSETLARQQRFNKGLRGLLDRLTGTRKKIKERNQQEAWQSLKRDQAERDDLIFLQADARRLLQARTERLKTFDEGNRRSFARDLDQFAAIKAGTKDRFSPEKSSGIHSQGPSLDR